MLEIRLAEAAGETDRERLARDLFGERFLIRRPLLEALAPHDGGPPVLLVDELDRADGPFEAFLLELLAEFQVSVPELGTLRAESPPIVLLTSNRTREVHDALKRRCLYHWIDYPSAERELAIVEARVPQVAGSLARQLVDFVQRLRERDLFKRPGLAETLDWARALDALGRTSLSAAGVDETLGLLLKVQEDVEEVRGAEVARLLSAGAASGGAA